MKLIDIREVAVVNHTELQSLINPSRHSQRRIQLIYGIMICLLSKLMYS